MKGWDWEEIFGWILGIIFYGGFALIVLWSILTPKDQTSDTPQSIDSSYQEETTPIDYSDTQEPDYPDIDTGDQVTQSYWYCWDTGDPSPHHLGHYVSGDHLCTDRELQDAGY